VIPSLHVEAFVRTTSIVDHELVIPGDVHDVGEWGRKANAGTTILAGHVNWVGQGLGALGTLADIAPGATVYLANREGVVSVWSVVSLRSVSKKDLPQALFASGGARRLVLSPAAAPSTRRTHQYADNVSLPPCPRKRAQWRSQPAPMWRGNKP